MLGSRPTTTRLVPVRPVLVTGTWPLAHHPDVEGVLAMEARTTHLKLLPRHAKTTKIAVLTQSAFQRELDVNSDLCGFLCRVVQYEFHGNQVHGIKHIRETWQRRPSGGTGARVATATSKS